MIVHVLRFSFKDDISEADYEASMEAFRRTAEMETVSFGVVGKYSGNPADGYTHSALFALADLETLEKYMYEPVHREADFIVHPHTDKFDAFDVSDGDEPDLAAKILDIQLRRLAADPELAALLGIDPAKGFDPTH
jgi:Stress responsive A/B Barrel Domain